MKILFMGTPEFAVPTLEKLCDTGNTVVGVFTQPDKPKGRGKKLSPPPVKEVAMKKGLPVYQPTTLKDSETTTIIEELAPDVIIVVAYGKILPANIINYPKYGCINIHASILPAYRGAGPIQWAVLNGEKETGVTIMKMDEGLDTGDVYKTVRTSIGIDETASELHDRLSVLGADALPEFLTELEHGNIAAVPQGDVFSYAPMLNKDMCPIDWSKSAEEVHNHIRGLSSWPCAVSFLNGNRVKIYKSSLGDNRSGEPGMVVSTTPLTVVCGDNRTIIIRQLQIDGGKRMKSEDFLRGRPVEIGSFFDKE